MSKGQSSGQRANDEPPSLGSIRCRIVIGPAEVEGLAEEAAREGLRPRRLEHHLLWLSRTDHGEAAAYGAIAFYRQSALTSYLPFRIRSHKLQLRLGEVAIAHLPFRALQLYGDGIVGGTTELPLALTALGEMSLQYDGLTLEETPTESALWREVKKSKRNVVFERSRGPHYVIDLPSSYGHYLQQLSHKTRTNIKRGARELGVRLGSWNVRTFTAPDQIREMVQLVEPIVTKTFHYRLLRQDLTTANGQLIRNLTTHARQGWLRGYILVGGSQPIAYAIGYLVDSCFQYELIGYDPEFSHASPGIVLLAHIVEDLIGTGIVGLLDFGAGEAGYKRLFGNRSYEDGALLICRNTVYATSAGIAERLFARMSQLGSRIVERTGVKPRLKKFLRSKEGTKG